MSDTPEEPAEYRDIEAKTWRVIGPIMLAVLMAVGGWGITTTLNATAAHLERHEARLVKLEAGQTTLTEQIGQINVHLTYIKNTATEVHRDVTRALDEIGEVRDYVRLVAPPPPPIPPSPARKREPAP